MGNCQHYSSDGQADRMALLHFFRSVGTEKRDFNPNGPLSIHVPSIVISNVNEELRKDTLGTEMQRRIYEDEPRGKGKGGQVCQ